MIDHRKHSHGIDGADVGSAVLLINHDVARQQETWIDVPLKSLLCKGRAARPEDDISGEVNSQLFFHLALYIDLAENSKSLLLQCNFDLCEGIIETQLRCTNIAIVVLEDCIRSSYLCGVGSRIGPSHVPTPAPAQEAIEKLKGALSILTVKTGGCCMTHATAPDPAMPTVRGVEIPASIW